MTDDTPSFAQTDAPDHPGAAGPLSDEDDALRLAVADLLERKANPEIASHGGRIDVESVENRSVYLRMSGGCQGCAASALTLRQGVETMLRKALPAIREIVDVTDHASGENPYYRHQLGQSPVLTRPVPRDCIGWDDGQLHIDPDYLAPRLGLDPQTMAEALERGELVIETGDSPGTQGDVTRVTARSASRAWAADVLPDGSAREVPPPGPLSAAERAASTLPYRIRRHLQSLPAARLPVTYGRLARALGMYAPGSIRKITGALETTMIEDAQAGRPFIAACVVGRGRGALPGQGFFALARSLQRGPRAGESEADFHARALRETLEGAGGPSPA